MRVSHCLILIFGAFGLWFVDKAYDEYRAQQTAAVLSKAMDDAFLTSVEDHVRFCKDAYRDLGFKPSGC